jgi:hypothetical protein
MSLIELILNKFLDNRCFSNTVLTKKYYLEFFQRALDFLGLS